MGVFAGKTILITGGTGSLGNQLVEKILPQQPQRLIIFSRDELKQHDMRQKWPDETGSAMRYFIGDVRDKDRLLMAFDGVDMIIHAAALKQIGSCEYSPAECVKTNILGTQNVIDAALERSVERILMISTDKAVAPANTYGCSKALAERIAIQGNSYAGGKGTKFSVCRYGNVVGSRGSVVPVFRQQALNGRITITDTRMTRFWITLPQAFDLVEYALTNMTGGEVFVPKLPSMKVVDLARAISPDAEMVTSGIRPGEKLHEALLSDEEATRTLDAGEVYIVQPQFPWWAATIMIGKPLPEGFRYASDTNTRWLSAVDLRKLLGVV